MICSIHQPQTFPWLGYFAKILQSDSFIFLDDVQFKKNEWQNRNRIKTSSGWQWITIPVIHNFGQTVAEVQINPKVNWRHKHLQSLRTCYGKAPFFSEVFAEIESLYERKWDSLAEFNMATVEWCLQKLGIQTAVSVSSRIEIPADPAAISPEERLILLTQAVGADTYLSGSGGHDYLEKTAFPAQNIELIFQQYEHPVYPQLYGDFISHLSILDLLFNHGQHSRTILEGGLR